MFYYFLTISKIIISICIKLNKNFKIKNKKNSINKQRNVQIFNKNRKRETKDSPTNIQTLNPTFHVINNHHSNSKTMQIINQTTFIKKKLQQKISLIHYIWYFILVIYFYR